MMGDGDGGVVLLTTTIEISKFLDISQYFLDVLKGDIVFDHISKCLNIVKSYQLTN